MSSLLYISIAYYMQKRGKGSRKHVKLSPQLMEVKIRNTSEAVLRPQYTPWPSFFHSPLGLGQRYGLAAYCGPHITSSVFLISIFAN